MADISDVIRADGVHILCWQARLGQLCRRAGPASGPELAATWDTVTTLIELHARAGEEICGPAIYGTGPQGHALAEQLRDARQDVLEITGEIDLQPHGSVLWWHLATKALAAWARYLDHEQHGLPADYRLRAERGLGEQLTHQWRALPKRPSATSPIRTRPRDSPPASSAWPIRPHLAWPTRHSPCSPAPANPAPTGSRRPSVRSAGPPGPVQTAWKRLARGIPRSWWT